MANTSLLAHELFCLRLKSFDREQSSLTFSRSSNCKRVEEERRQEIYQRQLFAPSEMARLTSVTSVAE